MYTHADLGQTNRSRAAASNRPDKKRKTTQLASIVDNRPEVADYEGCKQWLKPALEQTQLAAVGKMAIGHQPGKPVQLVQVQDSGSGDIIETTELDNQGIIALALRFYQMANFHELGKIQKAHSYLPISGDELHELAYGPRTRTEDALSEGESEDDDRFTGFRSLRSDEQPEHFGLRPPVDHDPNISARAHISAGSRARKKSSWVSGSRSIKVSGVWAAHDKGGRVAKFQVPQDIGDDEFFDLTRPSHQREVFPAGQGSALNTAKASQEMVIKGGVPPSHIESIYSAEKLSIGEYNRRKNGKSSGSEKLFRTRRKTKERPTAVSMVEIYNREQVSAGLLSQARNHWDGEIRSIVEQTNSQFDDTFGFEPVDSDDVADYLSELTDNPFEIDFIENQGELATCLLEIDQAVANFIQFMIQRYGNP